MIEIELGVLDAEVCIRAPASEWAIPVVRQALRSIGETVAADREKLEDAELALTEACANVVEHAYADDTGPLEVTLRPTDRAIDVSVRDFGRGLEADRSGDGFGLPMIEAIARDFEVREGEGAELAMAFDLGAPETAAVDGGAPGLQPSERVLRRLVAVIGAQIDMPSDRLMESLLIAELVARHTVAYVVGERVQIALSTEGSALELVVGPLERGGADAVLADSEVPVVGSVVGRLASRVDRRPVAVDGIDCEQLVVGIDGRVAQADA